MNGTEKLKQMGFKTVYNYLDKDPENNIPKILDWLIKHDDGGTMTNQVLLVKEALADPDNNWSRLAKSLWTDLDDGVRKKLFETVVINDSLIGTPRQMKNQEKYGCNIPWAILMDPTSACNLHCTGCWAAEYGNKLNLTLEELDSIITQGKKLGTYLYI